MLTALTSTAPTALSLAHSSTAVPPYSTRRVAHRGREFFSAQVQPAGHGAPVPPLVLLPPVGVGIDRAFYNRLHQEWHALGSPAAMHSYDLLGTGDASPKPRRFYSPEVWAAQLDDYLREHVKTPSVLVVQGGLLPCALEVWRRSGREAVAGVSLLSPPPLRFFSKGADSRKFSRRTQRLLWAASCSPAGNLFFRRLRGGSPPGARIREFTERSLFASESDVGAEWVNQCIAGARDARSRFSTFSYLCGSIPPGGAWRDERTDVFDSLDVPLQLLRGDYGGLENATTKAEELLSRARLPARECSAIVLGSRACLAYERPAPTARMLARFMERHYRAPPARGIPAGGDAGVVTPF